MKPYELLEHTADAKFRAYGKTRDEAFGNAILAMTAIVVDPQTVGKEMKFEITVTAKNLQNLLFDLLDEILFLHDTEKFLPGAVQDMKISEHNGKCTVETALLGDDARKYGGNLKAVTYSDMIIEEKNGEWTIQVVIDI